MEEGYSNVRLFLSPADIDPGFNISTVDLRAPVGVLLARMVVKLIKNRIRGFVKDLKDTKSESLKT